MQTNDTELERLETPAAADAPKYLMLTLGRIYMEAGLSPVDALRSALADFDSYHEEEVQWVA
jgi:hypothetical protein